MSRNSEDDRSRRSGQQRASTQLADREATLVSDLTRKRKHASASGTRPSLCFSIIGIAFNAVHGSKPSSSPPALMVTVRRLTPQSPPAAIESAAELLVSAFKDDQLTRIVSGSVPGLHEARMRSTLVTGVLDLVVFAAYDKAETPTVTPDTPGAAEQREQRERGKDQEAQEERVEGEQDEQPEQPGQQPLGVLILKPPGIVDRHRSVTSALRPASAVVDQSSVNSDGPHDVPVQQLLARPESASIRANYTTLRAHVHSLEERAFDGVTDLWFVSFVGVAPSAQGRGVGRTLCDAATDLIRDRAHDSGTATLALVAISEEAVSTQPNSPTITSPTLCPLREICKEPGEWASEDRHHRSTDHGCH